MSTTQEVKSHKFANSRRMEQVTPLAPLIAVQKNEEKQFFFFFFFKANHRVPFVYVHVYVSFVCLLAFSFFTEQTNMTTSNLHHSSAFGIAPE